MVTRVTVTYEITTVRDPGTVGDLAVLVENVIEASYRDILLAVGSGRAEEVHLEQPDPEYPVFAFPYATITVHSHKEATP